MHICTQQANDGTCCQNREGGDSYPAQPKTDFRDCKHAADAEGGVDRFRYVYTEHIAPDAEMGDQCAYQDQAESRI